MPDALSFHASFWEQPRPEASHGRTDSAEWSIQTVYEDEVLLVVNKPAGLATQPDPSGADNLQEQLQKARPREQLYLVHRLDRPVSGLIVLAKTARTQTDLTRQMSRGDFRKTYRALVSPAPAFASGLLENDLAKLPGENISRVVAETEHVPGKKTARLRYQVVAKTSWHGQELGWVLIELLTGRHHQIRVQLSHLGCPILNDIKYGGRDQKQEQGQLALQAASLTFYHPLAKKRLYFQLPPPDQEPWSCFGTVTEVLGAADKL
ncbi:MAG: RluA family pseudouridine synthase [Eubacteriales bacterium]|nr:RluA family pseudouridine synthase [Eubacteriales bacterium]